MTRPDGADSAVPSSASHATKTAPTSAAVTLPKPCILLSAEQRGALSLRILRHTRSSPLSDSDILAFQSLVNDSFRGPYHDENFGGKLRYPTTRELVDDLNHSDQGGWVFILSTAEGVPVAGAKVTCSGEGMDAGPGIHTLPNPSYIPDDAQDKPVFWLGALGSVAPGTGSMIIAHIKKFLAESYPHGYVLKAFTVAEWGVNPDFAIPQDSPLVTFFQRQAFKVIEYSWKAPGTWDSFYGGCLAAIEGNKDWIRRTSTSAVPLGNVENSIALIAVASIEIRALEPKTGCVCENECGRECWYNFDSTNSK